MVFPVTKVPLSPTGQQQDGRWVHCQLLLEEMLRATLRYPCGCRVLYRRQIREACWLDHLLAVSLQLTQTWGRMFPARGLPVHLEGEGVFPWGPGHVSLPHLVSEGTIQALFFAGDEDGYEKHDGERRLAFPLPPCSHPCCVFVCHTGMCVYI